MLLKLVKERDHVEDGELQRRTRCCRDGVESPAEWPLPSTSAGDPPQLLGRVLQGSEPARCCLLCLCCGM